jgi:hypothetical protein
MGPVALFDKSFLQSLSLDESVWFDNFFIANVCPLFFVETLADLDKPPREGRTPEEQVRVIAQKFPDLHGTPNVFHGTLHYANLMGYPVPMTGQIMLPQGHFVSAEGRKAAVHDLSSEVKAFHRWLKGEFHAVEQSYAQAWRSAIACSDLSAAAETFMSSGILKEPCTTLEAAKCRSEGAVKAEDDPVLAMKMAISIFGALEPVQRRFWKRWTDAACPPLPRYAPYAAYVVTVEAFFQIAVKARLIAPERTSNRVDISYLFYLPFCQVFISSDRLHRKCAPLFLRGDQKFIWGNDLKNDLQALNDRYSRLDDETKSRGIMAFACTPPLDADFLVSRLWDDFLPGWRERNAKRGLEVPVNQKMTEYFQRMRKALEAAPMSPDEVDFSPSQADILSIKRVVRKKKGQWWQVPKDMAL